MSFQCISCRQVFTSPEEQRVHYKTEFHKFNLKRKVVQLPPVTLEAYDKSQADAAAKLTQSASPSREFYCKSCKRNYSSQPAFDQHMKSKKHALRLNPGTRSAKESSEENPKKAQPKPPKILPESEKKEPFPSLSPPSLSPSPSPSPSLNLFPAGPAFSPQQEFIPMTEEELIDDKIAKAERLEINQCLFCREFYHDLDENVEHMTKTHGFFIPDLEYLKDIQGLITFLGEKISIGNACLYCNKTFRTMESVQSHMVSLCHCKLIYDNNTDEYDNYYDFTDSYKHLITRDLDPSIETEEEFLDKILTKNAARLSDNGLELVLKDGRIIGHRSLFNFYKQKVHLHEQKESVLVNRLIVQYRMLGWTTALQAPHRDITPKQHHRLIAERTHLGVKSNKLQRYLLDPTRNLC